MDMHEFLLSTPVVGQKVFVRVLDRVNRVSEGFADEVVVESVGRKYFTLEGDRFANLRFFIDGKKEQTKYLSLIKIYPNKKEYEDEKTRKIALYDIENALRYGALNNVSIENVKLICELLNTEATKKSP